MVWLGQHSVPGRHNTCMQPCLQATLARHPSKESGQNRYTSQPTPLVHWHLGAQRCCNPYHPPAPVSGMKLLLQQPTLAVGVQDYIETPSHPLAPVSKMK